MKKKLNFKLGEKKKKILRFFFLIIKLKKIFKEKLRIKEIIIFLAKVILDSMIHQLDDFMACQPFLCYFKPNSV